MHIYFEAMLPHNFFKHLQVSTNNAHKNPPKKEIPLLNFYKWLAQSIIFMILGLRSQKDLWQTKGIIIDYPEKEKGLEREAWKFINSHIEYSTDEVQNILTAAWQDHLSPGTYLTIDEARIPAHPRNEDPLSFNKDKPERWAMECHTLNDTATSYLLNFDLPKSESAFESLHSLATWIPDPPKHHITADKHFGNLPQLEKLAQAGFYATLNCKENSQPTKLWKGGLGVGLPKGKSRWAKKNNITAACFYNKGKLHLLSNALIVSDGGLSNYVERKKFLDHYDATKRGGDQFNLMVANFHNHHSHNSPSRSFLVGVIEWGLTNGYILYKYNTKTPLSHRDYLMEIVTYLLKKK